MWCKNFNASTLWEPTRTHDWLIFSILWFNLYFYFISIFRMVYFTWVDFYNIYLLKRKPYRAQKYNSFVWLNMTEFFLPYPSYHFSFSFDLPYLLIVGWKFNIRYSIFWRGFKCFQRITAYVYPIADYWVNLMNNYFFSHRLRKVVILLHYLSSLSALFYER